jgi:hypothetical protein
LTIAKKTKYALCVFPFERGRWDFSPTTPQHQLLPSNVLDMSCSTVTCVTASDDFFRIETAVDLQVDFEGISDSETRDRIEKAVRGVGDVPEGERWSVRVSSLGSGCQVLVKTPNQTRKKLFFLRARELPEAIPTWLRQYLLR